MTGIKIGDTRVGDGNPCYVVAEIGINHNGDIELAKQLIDMAEATGCNAVKFQKRTVDVVYSAEELAKPRENPFGPTNGDLKRGLEFGLDEYREIDRFCRELGSVAYGFGLHSPAISFEEYGAMFHGIDERVDVESLHLSTEMWIALAHDFLV